MKVWYESEDGIFFDNEDDCYKHEQKLEHNNLSTIVFFDKNNNMYSIGENIFDEDIYQKAEKVIIHNTQELADFWWLTIESGWCEFEQIKGVGEWIREDRGSYSGIWRNKKESD